MPEAESLRILVVDDDAPVRRMLERSLGSEGHSVRLAADGGTALAIAEREPMDLVVLDVRMPGLDGLSTCRRLRAAGHTVPILLLTAADEVADRVAGLDAGADDYLVKPFAPEELRARLRALARRGVPQGGRLAHGDLTLDAATRTATRGGRAIELTGRESSVLEMLLRQPRAVLTREAAIEEVWGGAATANVVDRYVTRLRRKLGAPACIHTVRGVGFTLTR